VPTSGHRVGTYCPISEDIRIVHISPDGNHMMGAWELVSGSSLRPGYIVLPRKKISVVPLDGASMVSECYTSLNAVM
jgi:hypothetical protein